MSGSLRLPAITAQDTAGQLRQLKSYLYQLVEQLNLQSAAPAQAPASQSREEAARPDPLETFSGIKSLIIQSADIVESYAQKIERELAGVYVAQSDYGAFTQETNQKLQASATALSQQFSNLQTLTAQVETLLGVNAYINTGLLYYDEGGVPVYGIEVGQRTQVDGQQVFNKHARFTPGKLSFYDANDNEVAYISDRKLFITHVQVTGAWEMGGFLDTVAGDGSLVTKYIGGTP